MPTKQVEKLSEIVQEVKPGEYITTKKILMEGDDHIQKAFELNQKDVDLLKINIEKRIIYYQE